MSVKMGKEESMWERYVSGCESLRRQMCARTHVSTQAKAHKRIRSHMRVHGEETFHAQSTVVCREVALKKTQLPREQSG